MRISTHRNFKRIFKQRKKQMRLGAHPPPSKYLFATRKRGHNQALLIQFLRKIVIKFRKFKSLLEKYDVSK